jgi:hypothetical protein
MEGSGSRETTKAQFLIDILAVSARYENALDKVLAEGVGFEPTIRFPVYTLSKRAP